jgi:lipoate-protein ligase A
MPDVAPGAPLAGPFACAPGFDDTPRTGAELMARDAARFARAESGAEAPRASFTWYTWDRPTLTVGTLQDAARDLDFAACARDGIPVVRRPTGGRAVLHADEWTYGAIVPLDHPELGGSLADSCRALVALVCAALEEAYGVAAAPADRSTPAIASPAGSAACFARAFGHEAIADGRKLMGSAQRRGRRVLLQQGSLLLGPGHERLARYLPGTGPALERALATGTVTLAALCGGRPDPAPFRAAFARAWGERAEGRYVSARSA